MIAIIETTYTLKLSRDELAAIKTGLYYFVDAAPDAAPAVVRCRELLEAINLDVPNGY